MVKRLIFLGSCSLFLSGLLYMTHNFRFLQLPLLILGMSLFALIVLLSRKIMMPNLLSVWFLFRIMSYGVILSLLTNLEFEFVIVGLGLIFSFLILVILVPRVITHDMSSVVIRAFLITHFLVIVIPIATQGIHLRYMGIFYNPNSFGAATATLASIIAALYFGNYGENWLHRFSLLVTFLFSSILVLFSMSRTSAVTIVAVVFALFVSLSLSRFSKLGNFFAKKQSKRMIAISLVIIALFLVIKPLNALLMDSIIMKFIVKSQQGDVLDARWDIWKVVLSEAKLLGYGRHYFAKFGLGAHNTYISLLGQFGIVVALSFICIIIILLVQSFIYARRYYQEDPYALVPLAATMCFSVLSLAEGMLMKSSMFIAFIAAGWAMAALSK